MPEDDNLLGIYGPDDALCSQHNAFARLHWINPSDMQGVNLLLDRKEIVALYHSIGEILAKAEADERVSQR